MADRSKQSASSSSSSGNSSNQQGWEKKLGDQLWNRMPKISSELFTLTYGSLVMQLVKDYEEPKYINAQLDKMGYNIGIRIIDDFLAKSGVNNCSNIKDTAEIISKVAFKMFLGITCDVTNWNTSNTSFSLVIQDNPLTDYVELPSQYEELQYCCILCGIIRGALESVQLQVTSNVIKDTLKGDDVTEIKVELIKRISSTLLDDNYKDA